MHDILVKAARMAISEVHSDTSVPLEETLASLEVLQEMAMELAGAVREDIERRDK